MNGKPDLTASLSSLAMLSLHLKEGKDYLDYLHGYIVHVLHQLEGQCFDAATVQKAVEQEFGLKIPVATFAICLKRFIKTRIVEPVGAGTQFRNLKLPPTTIENDRTAARARISEVTDELASFAYSRYSLPWDENASAAALAEFLRQYSIEFLKFAEAKS